MTSQERKLAVAFLVILATASLPCTDTWQRFSSSSCFSVSYPATWFRIGASADRLQLLSSKDGAEGIVIKRGQAEITVVEGEGSPTKTLEEVIHYYTKGASILSRESIFTKRDDQGCRDLKEVMSKEEAVPPADSPISVPHVVNTNFFCELGSHKVVVLLRNWEGDDRQQEYQLVALQMAKSIRLMQRE
jgi:hypothetical protein